MWFDTLCDRQWYTMMTCLLHKVNCLTDPNSGKGMRRNLPNITNPEFQTMCWPILFLKYVASNLMLAVSTFWPIIILLISKHIPPMSSGVLWLSKPSVDCPALAPNHPSSKYYWTLEAPKNTPSQSKPNPYWIITLHDIIWFWYKSLLAGKSITIQPICRWFSLVFSQSTSSTSSMSDTRCPGPRRAPWENESNGETEIDLEWWTQWTPSHRKHQHSNHSSLSEYSPKTMALDRHLPKFTSWGCFGCSLPTLAHFRKSVAEDQRSGRRFCLGQGGNVHPSGTARVQFWETGVWSKFSSRHHPETPMATLITPILAVIQCPVPLQQMLWSLYWFVHSPSKDFKRTIYFGLMK